MTFKEKRMLEEAMYGHAEVKSEADRTAANIDYNIMMGNLEAPEEVTENE